MDTSEWFDIIRTYKAFSLRGSVMTKEEKKEWHKAYNKARYDANPDKVKAHVKSWSKVNPDKQKVYNKAYRESNPIKRIALNAKRRAAKQKATPSWLSKDQLEQIQALYYRAKELEKLDGISRHVDHIVPLRGRNVSGLHVPWNLQILTAFENVSKGNRVNN